MTKWNSVPNQTVIDTTVENMRQRNFNVTIVKNKESVLAALKEIIPQGADVMTGSSTSLIQAGVTDFLQTPEAYWTNIQAKVWAENDEEKRNKLRREAVTSDYFMASVNAVTEDGQLIAVDASGSRVTAIPYAAKKVVLVIGAQKITANLEEAMARIREYVFPLEDARAQVAYGMGSTLAKWIIIEKEVDPTRIHIVLVTEDLGY